MDTPAEAVGAAHTLIWNVMRDRGYPADDRTASMDALSVYHGRSMEGYRTTLNLRADTASTEELREAMIRNRAHVRGPDRPARGPRRGRPATASRRSVTATPTVTPSPTTNRAPRQPPSPSPPRPRCRGSGPGRTGRGASRGERQPDRVPAPVGTHIPSGTHGRDDCYDPGPVRPGEGIRLRRTRRRRPRERSRRRERNRRRPHRRIQADDPLPEGGLRAARRLRAGRAGRGRCRPGRCRPGIRGPDGRGCPGGGRRDRQPRRPPSPARRG